MRSHKTLKPIEVGQRFGKLKYIEEAGYDDKGYRIARWDCDCGKETIARVDNVKHGKAKSCGCLPKSGRNKEVNNGRGIKKQKEQVVEGFFDYDAYVKSDFILQG